MSAIQIPSNAATKTVLFASASPAASAVVDRTMVKEYLPNQIKDCIFSSAFSFFTRSSSKFTIIVQEFDDKLPNEMYKAAETYLSSKISPYARCLHVAKKKGSKGLKVTMEPGETDVDFFQGIEFRWTLRSQQTEKSILNHGRNDRFRNMTPMLGTKSFALSFHKQHKDKALTVYLPHILQQFKNIEQRKKPIKIHACNYGNLYHDSKTNAWNGVNFNHPATFDSLAMNPELKSSVKEDLERFVRNKAYYRRVGKAWKRGYLLYGPPGTGKSSLVAAIANFLKFDVYDLELTKVRSNSALRSLLVRTPNRSIIVIEDIDCTIDLRNREGKYGAVESKCRNNFGDDKVTLSGLLNFIDGLWSSCEDERIIIITTNHKEMLDYALLRPGRMDMHIHMSYCCPSGFTTLLSNYHNVENHPLKAEVENLLMEVQATPAEVAEELMKSDDSDDAMRCLIKFLEQRKAEASEAAKKEESIIVEGSELEEV